MKGESDEALMVVAAQAASKKIKKESPRGTLRAKGAISSDVGIQLFSEIIPGIVTYL